MLRTAFAVTYIVQYFSDALPRGIVSRAIYMWDILALCAVF